MKENPTFAIPKSKYKYDYCPNQRKRVNRQSVKEI